VGEGQESKNKEARIACCTLKRQSMKYLNQIVQKDCLLGMKELPDNSIDLIATDAPYGISFMSKDWDRALPSKEVWKECLRVLKSGAFMFVMSIPRQDCLSRMIVNIEDAGFRVNFTPIFHAFASGFPKSENISLTVDKRECKRQLIERLGRKPIKKEFEKEWDNFREKYLKSIAYPDSNCWSIPNKNSVGNVIGFQTQGKKRKDMNGEGNQIKSLPATPQGKALDGMYSYNPKPAVEVILVAQKPMRHKTYVDNALDYITQKMQGKIPDIAPGCVNFDGCRIPYENDTRADTGRVPMKAGLPHNWAGKSLGYDSNPQGRFPSHLLVSDDVLNDGKVTKSGNLKKGHKRGTGINFGGGGIIRKDYGGDSGSFSRYFSLDSWFNERVKRLPESVQRTFPFLIVPKASRSEKNRGLEGRVAEKVNDGRKTPIDNAFQRGETLRKNNHPTCKSIKLMSYLITLGSRKGDIVLDPFMGSGTTAIASKLLGRQYIGFEISEEYTEIARARIKATHRQEELFKNF